MSETVMSKTATNYFMEKRVFAYFKKSLVWNTNFLLSRRFKYIYRVPETSAIIF